MSKYFLNIVYISKLDDTEPFILEEYESTLIFMAHTFNPSTEVERQMDHCEFETSLVDTEKQNLTFFLTYYSLLILSFSPDNP